MIRSMTLGMTLTVSHNETSDCALVAIFHLSYIVQLVYWRLHWQLLRDDVNSTELEAGLRRCQAAAKNDLDAVQ